MTGAYPPDAKDHPAFEASVPENLHRNHPSIIVWSMGNEDFFTDKATLPNVRELLKGMVALTVQLDPTRPAIGGCQAWRSR
jgi:beta-galactosidase/beta-glucuronidase